MSLTAGQSVDIATIGGEKAQPWVSQQTMQDFVNQIARLNGASQSLVSNIQRNNRENDRDTQTQHEATKTIGNSIHALDHGMESFGRTLKQNNTNLQQFGDIVKSVGIPMAGTFGLMTELADSLHSSWQEVNKSGQSFNGSILEMARKVNSAGMSLDSFQQTMKEGSGAIAAMGTDTFLNARKEMISTMREFGFFGMTLRETNENYGEFLKIQTNFGGTLVNSTQRLNKSFKDLMQNSSALSELFGKNKDQINRETMQKLGETNSVLTRMKLLKEHGQGAVDAYDKAQQFAAAQENPETRRMLQKMIDLSVNKTNAAGPEQSEEYAQAAMAGVGPEFSQMFRQSGDLILSGQDAVNKLTDLMAITSKKGNYNTLLQQSLNNGTNVNAITGAMVSGNIISKPGGGHRQVDLESQGKYTEETKFLQNLPSTMESVTTSIGAAVATGAEKIAQASADGIKGINTSIDSFVNKSQQEKVHAAIGDLDKTVPAAISDASETLSPLISGLGTGIDNLIKTYVTNDQQIAGLTDTIKNFWNATGEKTGVLGQIGVAVVAIGAMAEGVGKLVELLGSLPSGIATIVNWIKGSPSPSSLSLPPPTTPPLSNPGVNIPGLNQPQVPNEPSILTPVLVSALGTALGSGLIYAFNNPDVLKNLGNAIGDGFTVAMSKLTGHASGGEIGKNEIGKPSWVGEQGKELFVPDTSGFIVPNDKLNSNDELGKINFAEKYAKQNKVDGAVPIDYQSQNTFLDSNSKFTAGDSGIDQNDPLKMRSERMFKEALKYNKLDYLNRKKQYELDEDIYSYDKLYNEEDLKNKKLLIEGLETIHKDNEDNAEQKKDKDKNKKEGDPDKKGKDDYKDAKEQADESLKKAQEQVDKAKAQANESIAKNAKFANQYRKENGKPVQETPQQQSSSSNKGARQSQPQQPQQRSLSSNKGNQQSQQAQPTAAKSTVANESKPKTNLDTNNSFMQYLKQSHRDKDETLKHINDKDAEGKKIQSEYVQYLAELEKNAKLNHSVVIQLGKKTSESAQPTAAKNQNNSYMNANESKTNQDLANSIKLLHEGAKSTAEHEKKDTLRPVSKNENVNKMYGEYRDRMLKEISPKLDKMDLSKVDSKDKKEMTDIMNKLQNDIPKSLKEIKGNSQEANDAREKIYKDANAQSKRLQELVDKNTKSISKNETSSKKLTDANIDATSVIGGLTGATKENTDATDMSTKNIPKDFKAERDAINKEYGEMQDDIKEQIKDLLEEDEEDKNAVKSGELTKEEYIEIHKERMSQVAELKKQEKDYNNEKIQKLNDLKKEEKEYNKKSKQTPTKPPEPQINDLKKTPINKSTDKPLEEKKEIKPDKKPEPERDFKKEKTDAFNEYKLFQSKTSEATNKLLKQDSDDLEAMNAKTMSLEEGSKRNQKRKEELAKLEENNFKKYEEYQEKRKKITEDEKKYNDKKSKTEPQLNPNEDNKKLIETLMPVVPRKPVNKDKDEELIKNQGMGYNLDEIATKFGESVSKNDNNINADFKVNDKFSASLGEEFTKSMASVKPKSYETGGFGSAANGSDFPDKFSDNFKEIGDSLKDLTELTRKSNEHLIANVATGQRTADYMKTAVTG